MPEPASQADATAPAPATEPTPNAPPVEPPKDAAPPSPSPSSPAKDAAPPESAAARFARLAAQEKRLQAQRAEIQAARDAVAKERAEVEAYRAKAAAYKTDPISLLRDHGLTYEQVTQYLMNGGQPTPDLKIEATRGEVAALKAELDALKAARAQAEADAQAAKAQQAEQTYRQKLTAAAADGYELAAVYDPEGRRAWAVAEALFGETGEVPEPAAVMAKVEAEFEQLLDRAAKTKKWAGKYAPKAAEPPKPPAPTLTNDVATPSVVNGSPRSEAERVRRAIAAMEEAERRVKPASA